MWLIYRILGSYISLALKLYEIQTVEKPQIPELSIFYGLFSGAQKH